MLPTPPRRSTAPAPSLAPLRRRTLAEARWVNSNRSIVSPSSNPNSPARLVPSQPLPGSGAAVVQAVLARQRPPRIPYGPNYWQWFTHNQHHGTLPPELAGCASQLEMIERLGLDVFSRNLYCDAKRCWFGGLATEVFDGIEVEEHSFEEGRDLVTERRWHTRHGDLSERLRYIFAESTLVQEKFLVGDLDADRAAFGELVNARRWRFNAALWQEWQARVGDRGVVNAGELFSPLKLLHMAAGADQAVFLLADYPEECREWMARHEAAQLDLVDQMLAAGVPVMTAMDNLDSAFHPPRYVEAYSASFYERASRLCHECGGLFFIHACGRQRAILKQIAAYGVDGLEGVTVPPLGEVELDVAMSLCGDRMVITGGISAAEFERLRTYTQVFDYVRGLVQRMAPYAHRFILSASCATPYSAPWPILQHFHDAWREFGVLA